MRAVICGYYGKGNGGDEALLASLLQMLPTEITPVVLSGNLAETHTLQQGVEAVERMQAGAVLQALRRADVLIWGGGSLMQDATSWVSPLYYGGLMGVAKQLGLKTIAWAQGIGPLKRPLTRWIAQQAFTDCTAVSVRDRASAHLLSTWQIPFTLAPDPVWALNSIPVPELEQLPTPRVVVALRAHPSLTPKRLSTFTQALVHFQQVTQAYMLLVPFQPAQDLPIVQTIQPHLPQVSQIVTLPNPQALKGLFRGVKMTIAMRYHGLIMAAAEGSRCFALSYDPKVSQLMDELGMPGWDLAGVGTPPPDDPDAISRAWIECYEQDNLISGEQIQSLIDRALLHQELLAKAVSLH